MRISRPSTSGREPTGLRASELERSFGGRSILAGLHLEVLPGTLAAIEGPNGAGKTTILRIFATVLRPDSGAASVDGYDVRRHGARVRERIGAAFVNERSLYWRLTGRENLRLFARTRGLSAPGARAEVDRVLARLDLVEIADRWVADLSAGQRQRLIIARAALGEPTSMLVDEPLRGLDGVGIQTMLGFLRAQARRGAAVLVVTPKLDELSDHADTLHGLRDGQLHCLADGQMHDLGDGRLDQQAPPAGPRSAVMEALAGVRPPRGRPPGGPLQSVLRTFEIVRIFALKDLRIAITYRVSFALGLVTSFYGMISLFFVTRAVGHSATVGTPADYFRFIVIGVTLSNVLRAAVMVAAGNARADQTQGTLEILATQPISPVALALGWSALPMLEAILEGAVMVAVAVPLGFSGFCPDLLSAVIVLILSTGLFLAIGFVGVAFVLAIQQGGGLMGLVVGAMSLTGGAIFPVSVLPGPLHVLTVISPLTYTLRAMREAVLDDRGPVALLQGSLGVILIYSAIVMPLAVLSLHLSFRHARARGSLARF